MTKRRLAVTNRSAAFSSPACARRARRRSSSASVIRGSFCMSWRYWSKAVEGDERKKPLDLLSPVVCIRLLVETLWTDVPGWRAPFCWTRRITTGALSRQQPRFMPLSDRWVFGLRSGCGGYNGDSDQNDRSDNHPGLRNADQNCGDRQADNENDESDQVGAERGHDSSWFGFSWLESSKRRAGKSNCAGSLQLQLFFFLWITAW